MALLHLEARMELTQHPECILHGDFDKCSCPLSTDSVVFLVAVTGPVDREDGGDVVWHEWSKVKQAWEVAAEAADRRRASVSKSP